MVVYLSSTSMDIVTLGRSVIHLGTGIGFSVYDNLFLTMLPIHFIQYVERFLLLLLLSQPLLAHSGTTRLKRIL